MRILFFIIYLNSFSLSYSQIPQSETVTIEIYNTLGQKMAILLNQRMKAGHHEVVFNRKNLSSGIYIYKIQAGTFIQVRKMILLKVVTDTNNRKKP